ncbi:putative transcription factor WD40-like family [Helianthus debilis subsp. tardiflorus]
MRKIDQKQRGGGGGGGGGGNNGFIPSSIRSFSSYLRIVSSGASTVASTVRSAASTIVDRDADAVPDQVLWAGFDKLETEDGISRRLLLLGYQYGFQVWDVEDANNVRNIVSRYDGAVTFMQILPKPVVSNSNDHPLLVLCADRSFSAGGNARAGPTVSSNGNMKHNNDQTNGGYAPTVVWFYSFKSQSYLKELKFRSVVYSVRCSSRIVAVLQAAQVHCFDVATLEREYTILTNPIVTSSTRFENIGLGPLAMGPRWIAYSGSMVPSPNTCISPQHLTRPKTSAASGSNGSIVAHYAKQSSKQLAVGIVTLGDIGYKKLSRYYSEFLPDGNISQVNDTGRKDLGNSNGRLPDTENVGMVIVRDVVSKSVITQFKAHDSPIASLCFDPSGILLVTASVHGHSFNVFRITPGPANGASYTHLYRLQRGFTNAVIQDISFSVDSRWITISSSRGTSHLFAISPSGGPVNMQSAEEFLTTSDQERTYDAANKPPVTLSAVSRIRSGNSGWRNVVNGAAVAASGRMNSCSGVIASTFHKCKSNYLDSDSGHTLSKYHMLVFSSSGCVIQYALRFSSEVDTIYESSSPDNVSKLIVEPIQKWNVCNKQNRREREENIDIYGENAHLDSRKVFPERTENGSVDYFEGATKIKKESVVLEEKNHVYISEAELQMHALHTPLWAKPQICFQSLTIDDINVDGDENLNGELEIEKIATRTVEAKSRYLVPAVDYLQGPKAQIARDPAIDNNNNVVYEHEKPFSHGTHIETDGGLDNGDEETGEDDAGQMPVKDTDGDVNSDSCPISHTLPETVVDNREHSVSETRSELVNSNIGQTLENHFEDQGAEFD